MIADKVEDLMVPLESFPKISREATIAEAILALEKAQEEFLADRSKKQRILLVTDEQGRVVGKLSPADVIRGLESEYGHLLNTDASKFLREFDKVISGLSIELGHASTPWCKICSKAKNIHLKDFLRKPDASQVVQISDDLSEALHRFILGGHDSLFVTDGKRLVGMLRFAHVYREILGMIKDACASC
jgi:CBS domain-containing protein